MKRAYLVVLLLSGTALLLSACKGKEGPTGLTGPPGSSYQPPTPVCTVGYWGDLTTTGSLSVPAGTFFACKFSTGNPVTAISLSSYDVDASPTGQVRLALYNDGSGPGVLVAQTEPQNVVGAGWTTIGLPVPTYLPAGSYWVACLYSNSTHVSYTASGGVVYVSTAIYPWGTLPTVFPAGSGSSIRFGAFINICQ